jgi:hypothetical protein
MEMTLMESIMALALISLVVGPIAYHLYKENKKKGGTA